MMVALSTFLNSMEEANLKQKYQKIKKMDNKKVYLFKIVLL